MEAASGWKAAHVEKLGMIAAMTSKITLSLQLLNVSQNFLPPSDPSSGLAGGLHMYGCSIYWAQVACLVPYDSLML